MSEPLVSILIPAYNAAKTISVAIQSCLNQTYNNIELCIVNDGSIDNTELIIQQFTDTRIKYIKHNENRGIANSRNTLLQAANGVYIAWLDADDAMMPNRIAEQLSFMEDNPEIDICGSWVLGSNGVVYKTVLKNDEIIQCMFFRNCMFQPSVMSKNFYKQEGYFFEPEYDYVEDYEMWLKLYNNKVFTNIPKVLTEYSLPHDRKNKQEQNKYNEKLIALWRRKTTEYNLSESNIRLIHNFIVSTTQINNSNEADAIKDFLKKLMLHKSFKNMCSYHLFRLFVKCNFKLKLRNIGLIKYMPIAIYLKKNWYL